MKRWIAGLLLLCLLPLTSGCGQRSAPAQVASLVPQAGFEQSRWQPQSILSTGEGNLYRIVTGQGLAAPDALELAAGGTGQLSYSVETPAGASAADIRLQFLSTQGTGRIKLAAVDQSGRELAVAGWVVTGQRPADSNRVKWSESRFNANYTGQWISASYKPDELLAPYLAGIPANNVAAYRMTVEAGQGQHVLITAFSLRTALDRSLAVLPLVKTVNTIREDRIRIEADIQNQSSQMIPEAVIALSEPYGYGIITADKREQTLHSIKPGEIRRLSWDVIAARPHSINLGKPWQVGFTINGQPVNAHVSVAVADNRPGKIFYVMTEDLEAIDGAGYGTAWGNQNGWLDPEEVVVQIVNKAERLNAIAEQYGAKWTHYLAWPLMKAAGWAAEQSTANGWQAAVAAVEQSVRTQSARGHEYALHLHLDYDPDLPGNVVSFNRQTDGLWANHLRHGWAHSVGSEGHFGDYSSRTGILYRYQSIMDELSAASSQGQLITARVGSFDFGAGSASEAMSVRAYRKVGLWASSDADGNEGGITAGAYGKELYFTKPDDINSEAVDLKQIGLVEFRPTPLPSIGYDSQSAAVMNKLADEGVSFFTDPDNLVRPGVHGIIGFTHAMFVMGQGDWTSLDQGQFAEIAAHLQYLSDQYVNKGLVTYGTAGEMVRAWLDYHTSAPVVLYGKRLSTSALGVSEYAIQILGDGIPVDSFHHHKVSMKIPLYLRDSAYRAVILKNGQPVYATWGLPTPYNDLEFTIDDKTASYTLKVYHNKEIARIFRYIQAGKSKWK